MKKKLEDDARAKKRLRRARVVVGIFIAVAVLMLTGGVSLIVGAYRFAGRTVEVTGHRLESRPHSCKRKNRGDDLSSRTYPCYDITIGYAYQGRDYTFERTDELQPLEQTFPLWVDADDPSDARLSKREGAGLGWGMIALALVFFVAAFASRPSRRAA